MLAIVLQRLTGEIINKLEKEPLTMHDSTYDSNPEWTYRLLKESDKRRAAEYAYVLAVLAERDGDIASAKPFARESVALFIGAGINSLNEAASLYRTLNGVMLPTYVHEGVVRERLKHLLE